MLRAVTVFCGSSVGSDPRHRGAARLLGRELAARGLDLVYGGGCVGLMGELANAAFEAGGRVIGVIPEFLQTSEVVHPRLKADDLIVTPTLFRRKEILIERGDAFITLAGGLGTLDETLEVITLAQLHRHDKPCGLVNTGGFFDPLLAQLRGAVEAGFLDARHLELLQVRAEPGALIDAFEDPGKQKGPALARRPPS